MNPTIEKILEDTRGRFFTAMVVKRDGTIRAINGRTGVKKHLVGAEVPAGHVSKLSNMLVVYDVKSKGYRAINKENVLAIRINRVEVAL